MKRSGSERERGLRFGQRLRAFSTRAAGTPGSSAGSLSPTTSLVSDSSGEHQQPSPPAASPVSNNLLSPTTVAITPMASDHGPVVRKPPSRRPTTASATSADPTPGAPWGWPDPASSESSQPLGRQIVSSRSFLVEEVEPPRSPTGLSMPRRKPSGQLSTNSSNLRTGLNPRPPFNANARRNSRASVHSNSSSRRASLPALQLASPITAATTMASSSTTTTTLPPPANGHSQAPTSDDIYSSLSSYTFGASAPAYDADTEMVGPLQAPMNRRVSVDRTPRPSISYASGRRREDDSGDDDEVGAVRVAARGKMRALDPPPGARRPSLPTNLYQGEPGRASSSSGADKVRSTDSGQSSASEAELDTDVELDLPYDRRVTPGRVADDAASVHTFGAPSRGSGLSSRSQTPLDLLIDPLTGISVGPPMGEPSSPMTFAGRDTDTDGEPTGPDTDDELLWASSGLVVSVGDACYPAPVSPRPREREREGSVGTLRRGSASSEFGARAAEPPPSVPQSVPEDEPLPPAPPPPPPMPAVPTSTAYDGWDIGFILGAGGADGPGAGVRRPSGYSPTDHRRGSTASSARGSPSAFAFAGWGRDATAALRRGSAATTRSTNSDDAFMRHLHANDESYTVRKAEWSFGRERAEGARELARVDTRDSKVTQALVHMPVGPDEIWRCVHVGRFSSSWQRKVDGTGQLVSQRLVIKHIRDPYSKATDRGGPQTVVHKHSKAIAYSLFREYNMDSIREAATNTMSMNLGILLAPMRVQVQFTMTKTTRSLNSHGLLDDHNASHGHSQSQSNSRRPGRTSSERGSSFLRPRSRSRSASVKDKDKDRKDKDRDVDSKKKGKAKEMSPFSDSASSRQSAVSRHYDASLSPTSSFDSRVPTSQLMGRPSSSSSAASTPASSSPSIVYSSSPSSHQSSMSPEPESARTSSTTHRGVPEYSYENERRGFDPMDVDYDGELRVHKTTHQEAFATLDPASFQRLRSQGDRPEGSSIGARFRRLLGAPDPQPRVGVPHDRNFQPPWLTLAPRTAQEEHERVIHNLNESFKDVGLLPSTYPPKNKKPKSKRPPASAAEDVFNFVPEDGLFMLVPLWPKETDREFQDAEELARRAIPVAKRQFLVVYYRKTEEKRKKSKGKDKAREAQSAIAAGALPPHVQPADDPSQLRSFHVCARLVGYDQLRNSGVRAPSYGLSVSGPLADAFDAIPPPSVREREYDQVVIGLWHSRDAGMELLTEPLEKLGLCQARTPDMDVDEPVPLNSLGRAVAEMVWVGGMALTAFGGAP